jgi:hypothetical protein
MKLFSALTKMKLWLLSLGHVPAQLVNALIDAVKTFEARTLHRGHFLSLRES